MSLDKPPPSRYRVEEKDGRLIVHDSRDGSTIGKQFSSEAPSARSRSALDAVGSTPSAAPKSTFKGPVDQGKAKRAAFVTIATILLALFLIVTSLWPIVVLALIVAPVRQAMLDKALPAIKLYVEEGRFS
jgi:hypothetical protein